MNKLIIFALCLSACLAAYVPSGYKEISNDKATGNQTIANALNNGTVLLISALYKANYIQNTNFVVQQVNSYAEKTKSPIGFAFSAVFTNNNDTTVTSNFTVSISKAGAYSLLSYSATVSKTTPTPVPADFVDVSPSEYESSTLIKDLRAYGLNQVVAQAQQKYSFVDGSFAINKTNSVQRQIISDGRSIYKFNVDAYNADGVRIVAAYAVSHQPSNGQQVFMTSTYILVDSDILNTNSELNVAGYSTVTQATVDASTLIKGIRDFGLNALVQDGVQKDKLPNNAFTVKSTTANSKKTSGNVTKYKFSLVAVDNKGTTITGIYIVSYNTQTQAKQLLAFTYTSQLAA